MDCGFTYGAESLDRYLKTQAGQDVRRKANAVFVLTSQDDPRRVLGYYTLCNGDISESVREHHVGLHSFRSMRRMDARRRKASALRLRHSQSFASLRQRPSQASVRSTIQRLGKTTKPLT